MYQNFDDLIDAIKTKKQKKTCAVVAAECEKTLKAVLKAYKDGVVEPLLIGNEDAIREYLEKVQDNADPFRIIHAQSPEASAQRAVELVKSGEADMLMKGYIESSLFFGPLLDKQNGLQPKKILATFALFEIPTYHKLIAITDGGITISPTLEQKKLMIENAVEAMIRMGIKYPKVAVLAATEVVTSKMPATTDAHALQEMNERGEIKDCIIAGPMSYDLAINRESAEIKGFKSPVAGDADLLLVPDIASGNILAKSWIFTARAQNASFAIGFKFPILFLSRASSVEDKYRTLIIASGLSRDKYDD